MGNEQQQLLRFTRIGVWLLAGLLVIACILSILLVPRAVRMLHRLDHALDTVESLSESAEKALTVATETAEKTDQLLTDNAESVSVAMQKFNSVDFDALNRAIRDLADIINPLAKVVNFIK